MKNHNIEIDTALCIGCAMCQQDCPANNIAMVTNQASVLTQACLKCGHCAAICPKGAVTLTGFDEPAIEIQQQTRLDPQQLLRAIQTRRSIRRFQKKEIPTDVIEQIIQAGRFTPTAKNMQDVSYIVLKDSMAQCEKDAVKLFQNLKPVAGLAEKQAKQTEIGEHFFFKNAPVAILIVANNQINGSLAASNMALMAEAYGLGVLYSGYFTMAANLSKEICSTLDFKKQGEVITTLVLGYPDVNYYRTAQKETPLVQYR